MFAVPMNFTPCVAFYYNNPCEGVRNKLGAGLVQTFELDTG